MNNSTRRHPRTLNEAFPDTLRYGASIEKPYKHGHDYVLAMVIGAVLAIGLYAYVS